jgi:hypothetical protein
MSIRKGKKDLPNSEMEKEDYPRDWREAAGKIKRLLLSSIQLEDIVAVA